MNTGAVPAESRIKLRAPQAGKPERMDRLIGAVRSQQKQWTKTGNPRCAYGHWLLSQTYGLIGDRADGNLAVTDRGRDFIDNEAGETEAFLDAQEGLAKLLALVAGNGPTRTGGILTEWTEYLNQHSSFGSPTSLRDTMRRRLNNLLDRRLVSRKGTMYSMTWRVMG